jgi:hypothetical protein
MVMIRVTWCCTQRSCAAKWPVWGENRPEKLSGIVIPLPGHLTRAYVVRYVTLMCDVVVLCCQSA